MAPPKRPWFRCYVEMASDRKLTRIPGEQRWVWVVVMGMARSSPEPGVLLIAKGEPATVEDIARESFVPLKAAEAAVTYFERIGMVVRNADDALVVRTFLERQYESDLSTERSSKRRSKPVDATAYQRPINGDTTAMERSLSDTEPETESRGVSSDEDTQTRRTGARPFPDDFAVTAEMRSWAQVNAPDVDVVHETKRFREWAISRGKRYADWPSTWRNWMLRIQGEHVTRTSNRRDPNANQHNIERILGESGLVELERGAV